MTAETITREQLVARRRQEIAVTRRCYKHSPQVLQLCDEIEHALSEPDRLAAARAEGVREGIEMAAKRIRPTEPRPCDCTRCTCGNIGDAEAVATWDAAMGLSAEVSALSPAPAEAPTTPTEASDGWIEWKGGECPVPAETLVDVLLRDGEVGTGRGREWTWEHGVEPGMWWDIVAYRIVQSAEASAPVAEGDLDDETAALMAMDERLRALEAENKALREVLGFYADEFNHCDRPEGSESLVYEDFGARARALLQGGPDAG